MPGTPQEVTHAVAAAIGQQSGDALAKSIRVDLGNAKLLAELGKGADLTAMCSMALEEPYDEMLLEHFNHLRSAATGEHINAYAHMERVCVCFQSVFEKDTSWSLPAVHTLNTDLRRAAIRADEQVKENKASLDTEEKLLLKEKPAKLGEAARIIQKNFQITITDRAPVETSKKWGALHVINNLFKIYFQINNLRLCNNLIRAVEGPGFPKALNGEVLSGRSFPIAQLVTYHYFVGRLSLLNSQFTIADRQLSFAFNRCPTSAKQNKRLILRYLVPVRMVLGVFPSAALLEKYNLPYFVPICRAVDLGDISTFESKLAELQVYFIRCGSYLLVERSKTICYRNFFKRVQQTMRALQPDETHHIIDINKFMRCLGVVGVEMDVEEIECVLANLIFKGYIKGYIAHEKEKLVLSKTNAFPARVSGE